MTVQDSILWGVFSGVLTSALVFLIVTLFHKVLVPWYRAEIYRGLDISGTWEESAAFGGGVTGHSSFVIRQRERHISETRTIVKQHKDGKKVTVVHDLTGFYQDGTLMLLTSNSDRRRIGHSTLLLRTGNAGQTLSGMTTLLDMGSNQVTARETTLRRPVDQEGAVP